VRDLHNALQGRGLAYTTTQATLVRMAEKGWLSRTKGQATRPRSGRGCVDVYACSVTRGALLAATITEASERLPEQARPE
jgi:hypothetical protein